MHFVEVVDQVMRAITNETIETEPVAKETVVSEPASFIRRNYEAGEFELYSTECELCQQVSDKPATSPLARALAKHNDPPWTVNQRHETMILTRFQLEIPRLADGSRDQQDMLHAVRKSDQRNDFLQEFDAKELKTEHVSDALDYLAENALLMF